MRDIALNTIARSRVNLAILLVVTLALIAALLLASEHYLRKNDARRFVFLNDNSAISPKSNSMGCPCATMVGAQRAVAHDR